MRGRRTVMRRGRGPAPRPRGTDGASSAGSRRTGTPCGVRPCAASAALSPFGSLTSAARTASTGSAARPARSSDPVRPAQRCNPRRKKSRSGELSDLGVQVVGLVGPAYGPRPGRPPAPHRAAASMRSPGWDGARAVRTLSAPAAPPRGELRRVFSSWPSRCLLFGWNPPSCPKNRDHLTPPSPHPPRARGRASSSGRATWRSCGTAPR